MQKSTRDRFSCVTIEKNKGEHALKTTVTERLFALRDESYGDFAAKLTPNLPRERVIGVRTPALRALAKELHDSAEAEAFLAALPHTYFEENNLHGFLLEYIRDFETCIAAVALECGRIVLCCEKLFGNEHHLGGLDGTGPLHEVFVSEIAAHDNHHYEQPRKQLLGIFLEKQFGLIESGLDFLFRVYMFPFPGFRISVRGFSGHK